MVIGSPTASVADLLCRRMIAKRELEEIPLINRAAPLLPADQELFQTPISLLLLKSGPALLADEIPRVPPLILCLSNPPYTQTHHVVQSRKVRLILLPMDLKQNPKIFVLTNTVGVMIKHALRRRNKHTHDWLRGFLA